MSPEKQKRRMAQLFNENAVRFIGVIIWKFRAQCPDLAITLTVADFEGMQQAFPLQNAKVHCSGADDKVVLQILEEGTGGKLFQRKQTAGEMSAAAASLNGELDKLRARIVEAQA